MPERGVPLEIGKGRIVTDGGRVAILSFGARLTEVQKAAEALTKYIVVDMYAKAVQGMPAEEAVKWAETELKKIYSV